MQTPQRIFHNVLILTGQPATTRVVQEALAAASIRGTVEADLHKAWSKIEDSRWDLILIDLPAASALEILAASKSSFPERPIVLIGLTEAQAVVQAARLGCDDYLSHPLTRPALKAMIENFLPNHLIPLAASSEEDSRCLYQIAGRSDKLLQTIRLAAKVAPTSMPVLIAGPSGTGKELISYLIHRQSSRRNGPYIRVNCASLSESLLESELFGHERGAFTGAHARHKGRFERAHGGTLLLDEISETGPRLQAELLRVLEQQDFERVGGSETVRVNVRVISTSNKDLLREVELGRFRRDLYYRVSGVHLTIPALSQRIEDVEPLVWHFVNLHAREVRRKITHLDEDMLERFRGYSWPGNVRQLRNIVRTLLVLGEGPILSMGQDMPLLGEIQRAAEPDATACPTSATTLSLQELERRAILEALQRSQRNQVKAAALLGITDRTLREKLRRYRQDGQLQTVGESQW